MKKTIAFCFIWIGIFFTLAFAAYLLVQGRVANKTALALMFLMAFLITQKFFSEDQL